MTETQPLFVKGAPKSDANELCVRMHVADKPQDISWGDCVHISVPGNRKRVTCKIRGDDRLCGFARLYHIYINKHLRDILDVNLNHMYDFEIKKAPSWAMPFYIVRYHPDDIKRFKVRAMIIGTSATVIGVIAGIIIDYLL